MDPGDEQRWLPVCELLQSARNAMQAKRLGSHDQTRPLHGASFTDFQNEDSALLLDVPTFDVAVMGRVLRVEATFLRGSDAFNVSVVTTYTEDGRERIAVYLVDTAVQGRTMPNSALVSDAIFGGGSPSPNPRHRQGDPEGGRALYAVLVYDSPQAADITKAYDLIDCAIEAIKSYADANRKPEFYARSMPLHAWSGDIFSLIRRNDVAQLAYGTQNVPGINAGEELTGDHVHRRLVETVPLARAFYPVVHNWLRNTELYGAPLQLCNLTGECVDIDIDDYLPESSTAAFSITAYIAATRDDPKWDAWDEPEAIVGMAIFESEIAKDTLTWADLRPYLLANTTGPVTALVDYAFAEGAHFTDLAL